MAGHVFGLVIRHFSRPKIGIPRFLDKLENGDQRLGILALDVIPSIVKNIDDRVIIQPQHRACVKSKTVLQRNSDFGLEKYGFSLLDGHKRRCDDVITMKRRSQSPRSVERQKRIGQTLFDKTCNSIV